MRLALQGQEVARSNDVLKDPMVLEFLSLPESPRLVESKLEQALIGNLQTFLMELGKGFAFVSRRELRFLAPQNTPALVMTGTLESVRCHVPSTFAYWHLRS